VVGGDHDATEEEQQGDAPVIDVGLNVEQAYEAIPHRRTVWVLSPTP